MALHRSAAVPFTLAGGGRTVTGYAARYGDTAPQFRERIEPGAFVQRASPLVLRLQHDSARPIADTSGSLRVADSATGFHASTPLREGSAELDLVRRGTLTGLSVEMEVMAERRESGLRVIERAKLLGIGLVDEPAYPASTVELRARWNAAQRMARYSSTVPTGRRLACECSDGANLAEFMPDAFTRALAEIAETGADVTAVVNSYDSVIASTAAGTLRLGTDADGALTVDVDVPDTELGHRLLDTEHDAGTVARPFVADPDGTRSELVERDGEPVRRWLFPRLRAIVLTGTDARAGWPAPTVTLLDGDDAQRAAPDRRLLLPWL